MNENAIDVQELLERVQEDKDLMIELLDIFIVDFKEKREPMAKAIEKKDFEELKSLAHSLKGSSGNISAKELHASLIKLDQMAKERTLVDVEQLLAKIDWQFAALEHHVAKLKNQSSK